MTFKARTIRTLSFLGLLAILTQCGSKPQPGPGKTAPTVYPEKTYPPETDYLPAIESPSDFAFLTGPPLSSQFAQVDAVKLVYDLKTDSLYFIQHRKYNFHYEFCSNYLSYTEPLNHFNKTEYGHGGERRYLLANLNHYHASDTYTLEFFSDDWITTVQIADLYQKVGQKVFFKDKFYLVSGTDLKSPLPDIGAEHLVSVDRLFEHQLYQPMVFNRSYGYLQKVSKADFETHAFTTHDIILTDFLPNDMPYCQGILTTAFQTPLAHINILSHNRKTPNCAYKNAWQDARIQRLVGKLVYYEVLPDTFYLREAQAGEARFFWDLQRNTPMRKLQCDLREKELLDVSRINRNSVSVVGAKAANFGELEKIRLPDKSRIPVPEGAFAIPFYYYRQHIEQHHLQGLIDEILQNDSIRYNRVLLEKHLENLRNKIKEAPLDAVLLQKVLAKMKSAKGYTDFRFRSSTNAEDLAGFTGAGLYDSKTGSLSRPDKGVEEAIKKVWASVWSLRAFEERMNANIDQSNLAMGILAHRSFGPEEANGVAITRNLYRDNYPALTINVQKGEASIVLPEQQATPEQLLIKYKSMMTYGQDVDVEYITHSSLNDFKPLLQKEEIRLLATYLYEIKKHFYYASGGMVLGPDFYNFAMDVEFKLDKGTRKIYIKQARPY